MQQKKKDLEFKLNLKMKTKAFNF